MTTASDAEASLETLALRHYENFPVASRFLPKKYRRPIHLIYAYARTGDDIADEWTDAPDVRLRALDDWSSCLHAAVERGEGTPFFLELASVIGTYGLELKLFDDLIEAFRMDVRHHGFAAYEELLEYCRHSANPVGRLMLQIFGSASQERCALSDAFCTALQLANFWQDLFIDIRRERWYIPEEDLVRFGVTRSELHRHSAGERMRPLMRFEVERTRALFQTARRLPALVNPALRFELKLIWHGGMRILEKIERGGFDTLSQRPALTAADKLAVLFRACVDG
ncbi:MAG: squalene synthase HpnC [Acidobacteriota bacterium]